MLNQTPTEAQNSATFLKNYLECVEDLPFDISKTISIIRELESKSSNIVNESEELAEKIISSEGEATKKLLSQLKEILISLQEIKSEKLYYAQILAEKVESKSRSLEQDFQNDITNKTEENTAKNASIVQQVLSHLPLKNISKPCSVESSSTNKSASDSNNNSGNDRVKRTRRTRMDTVEERAETPKPLKVESGPSTPKEKAAPQPQQQQTLTVVSSKTSKAAANIEKKKIKKKKKASSSTSSGKQSSSNSVQEQAFTIEDENDDEETYCLCGQVSYGEMILCENDACKIEWFHFSCVQLLSKPKGRWYCPTCRGDRPNVLNKCLRKKS